MSSTNFDMVDDIDWHKNRRQIILKEYPQIINLYGHDVNTAYITFIVFCCQLLIAKVVADMFDNIAVIIIIVYIIGAPLAHWLGQTVHETSHELVFGNKIYDKILAWFANMPLVFPLAETFHRYHIEHHRYLGVVDNNNYNLYWDTDLPANAEVVNIPANSRIRKFLWLFLYWFVYLVRGLSFVENLSKLEISQIMFQIVIDFMLYYVYGYYGFLYLALSMIIGHSLHPVAAHFVHEHYVTHKQQETNSYYGWLNHISYNVGYHVEHHDFMYIPGSKLPQLHNIANKYYKNVDIHYDMSWTYTLFNFIWNLKIGPKNRIIRTKDCYDNAMKKIYIKSQEM